MSRIVTLFLFIFTGCALAAPKYSVTYEPKTQQVRVATELCLYGRGIQPALIDTSFKNLNNYLRVQYRTIAAEISETYNFRTQQQQYLEYLLTLKLTRDSLNHTFSFIGNDTCTNAEAKFPLSEEVNFETLFEFPVPENIHFVSAVNNIETTLRLRLNEYDIALKQPMYENHLTPVAELVIDNMQHQYLVFDLHKYKASLSQSTNSVYILAEQPYHSLLSQYLQSKAFTVQNTPDNAYWTIDLKANIEQQKYLSLVIDLSNKNDFSSQLINNAKQLPATSLGNETLLAKFFNVHLELLKLGEQLRANK